MVCPYEERSALLDSAEFLNARMREVRDSGKVVGLDRIAVMVALNLANEFLQLKAREAKLESEASGRVKQHARARRGRSLPRASSWNFELAHLPTAPGSRVE